MATGTVLEVVMPQMGVSVSEGTVTRWLRNVGDTVSPDESLLEVSTDKVDTEVPSPGAGVLREILVAEGQTVAVGTVLARIGSDPLGAPEEPGPLGAPETESETANDATQSDETRADEKGDETPSDATASETETETTAAPVQPTGEASRSPAEEPPTAATGPADQNGPANRFVSPVVARIAAEHGIDPTGIAGSGRHGRVTKKDVLARVEAAASTRPADTAPSLPQPDPEPAAGATTPAPQRPAAVGTAPVAAPVAGAAPPPEPGADDAAGAPHEPLGPGESLEPMSIMRRGIAEHMRRSLETAAHVTSAIEVDMSKVAAIRERIKSDFAASHAVNPTYLAFIARATVDTLGDWPWINAELRGEAILTRSYVNLGVAVSLEGGKGLIVPVLRHAEGLNLLGMARGIADLAERARTRRLLPDDVQGGTFTITNPGSFGTLFGTPIISQPQSAILGTYAIVKRPWVISDDRGADAIAIRSIMNLTLTYDHRLVDGAYAAQFLRDLADRLQGWGEADY